VGLATLDLLGLLMVSVVVPGGRANDRLYVLLIRKARSVVDRRGDCKMGALATRAT